MNKVGLDVAGQLGSHVRAVAVQADGKILTLSNSRVGSEIRVVIARFLPDGALDPSWGQDGLVISHAGEGLEAYTLVVDAERILVVGTCWLRHPTGAISYPMVIVRYGNDGRIDQSFAHEGMLVSGFDGQVTTPRGLAIQGDGKILVGGSVGFGPGARFALARYLESGAMDPAFGNNGLSQISADVQGRHFGAAALSLQSTGQILIVGALQGVGSQSEWAVSRCNQDGSVDAAFGEGGFTSTTVERGAQWSRACSIVVRQDDSFVVGGYAVGTCAVVGYEADGRVDKGFGESGIGIVGFRAEEGPQMLAMQTDKKVLLSGMVTTDDVPSLAVARLL